MGPVDKAADHIATNLFAEDNVCNYDEHRLQAGERNEEITKCDNMSVVYRQESKHSS